MNLKYGLIALVGLGFSANVSAQALTCSDITFTPDAFAAYQQADAACLEIVDRDGGLFAKMTVRIVAQTSSGTHFRFRHADGELGPSHKAQLPAAFMTRVNNQTVALKDIAVRQDVNVYIGQDFWTVNPVEVVEAAAPPPPPPALATPGWPSPEPPVFP